MGHTHTPDTVKDSDSHFIINTLTRAIVNANNKKLYLIQYDHNSERFTFEIDRTIEGHNILDCNRVQVHYINTSGASRTKHIGLYEVSDLAVDPDDSTKARFSWLISQNATWYDGGLSFLVSFACVSGDEVQYRWNSSICNSIIIAQGINNNNAVVEAYADELLKWEEYMTTHFQELSDELESTVIPSLVDDCYVDREFATSDEVAAVFELEVGDISGGSSIAQQKGQSTTAVMSQKAVTDEINAIWSHLNYTAPTISLSLTPTTRSFKLPATFTLTKFTHSETNISNFNGKLTFKRGSTVLKTDITPTTTSTDVTLSDGPITLTTSGITYTLSGTDANGIAISKSYVISAYYTSYIGASATETISDTVIAGLTDVSAASLAGTKSVTISGDSKYIWFVTTKTISSIKSKGFDVPFHTAVTHTYNGTTYNCYRTTNKIVAGSNSFVIA